MISGVKEAWEQCEERQRLGKLKGNARANTSGNVKRLIEETVMKTIENQEISTGTLNLETVDENERKG